jgi:hypothetical protein
MVKLSLISSILWSLLSESVQQGCQSNGRQGTSLSFTNVNNPYLSTSPPSQGATADSGLFYRDLTVELFVNLSSTAANSYHPLIGNLDGQFNTNMGVASGWRLACRQTSCCFQAFVGYAFVNPSDGFDAQFRNDRRTLSFQQVCTASVVPTNQWFHLAATYESATGQATIYVNGTVQGRTTFRAVGDPDFGFDSSLLINYDYQYATQVL